LQQTFDQFFEIKDDDAPKMVTDTSKQSFMEKQENIETDQQRYLEGLYNVGGAATDQEVKQCLKLDDPNKIRPRRYECEKMGYVQRGEKRQCRVTGKTVYTFYLTQTGLKVINGGF
jgi:hypothetical protein